jgi:chromosome partitioning protein
MLHREAPEIARDADHVVIDGPPRLATLMRSALRAADIVVIPAPAMAIRWGGCFGKRAYCARS